MNIVALCWGSLELFGCDVFSHRALLRALVLVPLQETVGLRSCFEDTDSRAQVHHTRTQLRHNQSGQMLIFVGVLALCLIIFIFLTIGIGQTVSKRINMQDATDAACISASTWQARGLNVLADLNYALVAAAAGDLVSIILTGGKDADLVETIQELQDTVAKTFPGAAGLGYRLVFKENIKDAECFPLLTGINDGKMFSLRVKRKEAKINLLLTTLTLKLWMELDEPDYWENQLEDGPYIRLIGLKESENILAGSNLLGLKIPRITTVAQAMPYGNNLWDPTFSAKLVPVTADVPGIDAIIMH